MTRNIETPNLAIGDIIKIRKEWLRSERHRQRHPWILEFGEEYQRVTGVRMVEYFPQQVKTNMDDTFRSKNWYKKIKL